MSAGETIPGGDFVVTITHTVHLRVPDVAVVAEALDLSPTEALIEIADDLGVKGLELNERDALPLGSFEVVRVDRVDTDVDRVGPVEFTDGGDWRLVAATGAAAPALVVTDKPLTERQAAAVADLIRTAAPRGPQQ